MRRLLRLFFFAVFLGFAVGCAKNGERSEDAGSGTAAASISPANTPRLTAIAPRMISNASSYPVMIYGEHLSEGTVLSIRARPPLRVPTKKIDDRHLTARIPAGLEVLDALSIGNVSAVLIDTRGSTVAGEARLTVANDLDFPTPYAMELGDENSGPWILSRTTDELRAAKSGEIRKTCDRPRAAARWKNSPVVLCEEGALEIFGKPPRNIAGVREAADLAIDETKNIAYIADRALDKIHAVDLDTLTVKFELPSGVNPQTLALAEQGSTLIAGNYQSADISIIDLATRTEKRIRPKPGTPIIGGHTEKFTADIMGGTAARGLAYSESLHLVFAATLGPNIGPNAARMEVTENGGISVIDAKNARWLRHVSILYGVPDAIALDDRRGILWVADGSTGRVVALDTKKLSESDTSARAAQLAVFELPVPAGVPLIRPEGDFGIEKRARLGLHFGAKALRASGESLFVMSRFSGEVLELDTRHVRTKKLSIKNRWPAFANHPQEARRRGQVVYDTDLGNSRMTCDTCHPEGHSGGIMFSKGRPIRIYRAPTCRAIRESPPYFTPSRLPSIKRTIIDVLARNRFQNPPPTEEEVSSATEYVGSIAVPPNPFHEADGSLPAELLLPDGTRGRPVRGLALFEGKAGCATDRCHPPPHFTADQDPDTRGLLELLETPVALMLRPEQQDLEKNFGQPPPSLSGVWDQFPLFLSGAGGNEVQADGTIAATHPFALRWMLENPAWKKHTGEAALSAEEISDLLAYLMTL